MGQEKKRVRRKFRSRFIRAWFGQLQARCGSLFPPLFFALSAVLLLCFCSGCTGREEGTFTQGDLAQGTERPETEALRQEDTEEVRRTGEEPESTEALAAMALEQQSQRIRSLPAGELALKGMAEPALVSRLFFAAAVDDALLGRILGKSYVENENIALSELSYLKMLHYGLDGNTYVGEMIVNQKIEAEVLEIFQTLYEHQYPIERMTLIDEYDADDEASMDDNNTSAFNYRTIAGSGKLSNHSYGMAIDLNPKYNPYVKENADGSVVCQPKSGMEYADRTKEFPYKIDRDDLAYQLFVQAGFAWGGDFRSVKDYQHFEKGN